MTLNEIVEELERRGCFTRDEVIALLRSVYAEDEQDVAEFATDLYAWAEGIRKSAHLLDMILKGLLKTTYKSGELQLVYTELASEIAGRIQQ